MDQKLLDLKTEALNNIEVCDNLVRLNELRVEYLGKKGFLSGLSSNMGKLQPSERAEFGKKINEVKTAITTSLEEKRVKLEEEALNKRLESESIDISLNGVNSNPGTKHIIQEMIDEISEICLGLGFEVADGPEVEEDLYNFELLNLPKDHPARDMQDTFYITENTLLRTHTSPVQARTLLSKKGVGPVRVICPGRVYRRDDDDSTHSHQFNQMEALVVGEDVTLADLKGTLSIICKKVFGESRVIRFRSSFFPFTEPSVEVDVSCAICNGKGCNVCKGSGWIEVLGAGMVHPNVLEMNGFDSKKYQGYAFGLGVDRFAMLKYGITDIRHFYNNDLRVLKQFIKER